MAGDPNHTTKEQAKQNLGLLLSVSSLAMAWALPTSESHGPRPTGAPGRRAHPGAAARRGGGAWSGATGLRPLGMGFRAAWAIHGSKARSAKRSWAMEELASQEDEWWTGAEVLGVERG